MAKLDPNTTLRRLRNRYRLVVMNDDTYEEVVTFKLSRLSVYVALSTIFVLLVGLTVAIIVFSPLRFYIPGYGDKKSEQQLRVLKIRTDSLEQAMRYKDQYWKDVKAVLTGDVKMNLDTNQLVIPKAEEADE
jgi:hypothetical protein